MVDDLLTARRAEPEKWSAIGQFTAVLDQAVGLLPYIAAEEDGGSHVQWVAYTNSLTTDLRALYGFLLGPRNERDAHRTDFVQKWTPSKTSSTFTGRTSAGSASLTRVQTSRIGYLLSTWRRDE